MRNYQYMIRCTFASNTHAIFTVNVYDVNQVDLNSSPCIYEENIVCRREGMMIEMKGSSLRNIDIIPQSIRKEIDTKLNNFADFIFKIR